MAIWDLRDKRYKGARLLLGISLIGLVLSSVGLFLLFRDGNSESGEAAPSATATRALPDGRNDPEPVTASTSFELAQIAIQEKHLPKAEELLRKSVVRKENVDKSLSLLGALIKERGAYREAIEIFDQAIELNPQADHFFKRGECHESLEEWQKAMADFDKAVEISPSNPLFTNKRYLFMIRTGRQQEVESDINLKLAVGITNDKSNWLMAAAAVALKRKESKTAAVILERAAQIIPPNEFDYLLGDSLFDDHRTDSEIRPFYSTRATVGKDAFQVAQ